MPETTLRELFADELRDILHGERQLVKALPKMAKAATSPDLRKALEDHLAETEGQVTRLEQAFELIDEPVKTKVCKGLQGIVEEGSEAISGHARGAALDAAIIGGGQRAEHYEMAVYGTLMAWAKSLGHDEVAALLSETLDEEKAADEKLSQLAEAGINEAAQSASSADEDEDAVEDDDADDAEEPEDTGRRSRRMSASSETNGRSASSSNNGRAASGSNGRARGGSPSSAKSSKNGRAAGKRSSKR